MKVALSAVAVASAIVQGKVYLHEDFSGDSYETNWVTPERDELGKFVLSSGEFHADADDLGLKTSQDAKFYMTSRKFDEDFDNTDKPTIIQLSVKHEQQIDCGGGYIKVFPPGVDQESLNGESPYNIMFGPDICGSKKMVHVIISNKDENHLITKNIKCPADIYTHAYTLILNHNNTYSVMIDNKEVESGSLYEDWNILEPKKIKDPEQSKPEDWVDDPKMEDPEDVKPEGWDDVPPGIPDENAQKPDDWDDEMDGEYEVPLKPNPKFRGPWKPRRIDNPDYKGEWEHPLIDNPDFVDDPYLYQFNSGVVAIDLWQVKSGTIFDDIIVTDDLDYAKESAEKAIESAKVEKDLKAKKTEAEEAKRKEEEEDFVDEEDDMDDFAFDDERDEL